MKKINWKEKPKRWEVALMVAAGILCLGQAIYLHNVNESDRKLHDKKIEAISQWTDGMVATAPRANLALQKLTAHDVEILNFTNAGKHAVNPAILKLAASWDLDKFKRCVEVLPFIADGELSHALVQLLRSKYKAEYGTDVDAWYDKLWEDERAAKQDQDATYPDFKATLYRGVNPLFGHFFGSDKRARINLSEVRYGGRKMESLELARSPIIASLADTAAFDDQALVFGLETKGIARAYSQRLAVEQKLFVDRPGGIDIVAIYFAAGKDGKPCLRAFENKGKNGSFAFGASGFVYRSQELIFDDQSKSLWLPESGQPVIGDPIGLDKGLRPVPITLITWGRWKKDHPQSTLCLPVKAVQAH